MASHRTDISRLLSWSQFFFFFSGATGLIYQVLWTRRLSLTFGHTVLAVSTVLTAFMAGLAIGSFAAGRWTDGRPAERPVERFLSDYAYLEGFIGLWALLTLPMLGLAEDFYIRVAAGGASGAQLHLSCFLAAAAVLVPPTAAMGATVPILTRLLTEQPGQLGPILSRLYGLNTLGALSGAFLAGFWLLPTLGLTASMVLAALTNLTICGGALRVVKQLDAAPTESANSKKKDRKKKRKREQVERVEGQPLSDPGRYLVPLTFAAVGAGSMAYQVAWNRALCLSIGSSVYTFSSILVMFLAGIGLGSLLYSKVFSDRPPELLHLGLLYLAIALTGALTELVMPLVPKAFVQLFPLVGESYFLVIVLDLLLVGLLLLPPTLCMGLGFPLATAAYARSTQRLGRSVGEIYGANTLGCIAGSFLTGFVLVPQLGAQWSLKAATLIYLSSALLLLLASPRFKRSLTMAILGLATLASLLIPSWEEKIFTAGAAVYVGMGADGGDIFYQPPAVYIDGLSSTVSFHLTGEYWEIPHMRVNGKTDASRGGADRMTQYMLGYLPTLLHPSPRRVGIIGLGGGFTVEAVAQCPGVESIGVAELEPAVVDVGEYWKPYNSRVLEDPRVKVHVNDGRTFVLAAQEKFDVLISEPSNPWIAGIGNLFTRDFYAKARSQLTEGGIMCQWFNIYAVSKADMEMVVRGFYQVFPEGQLWQSSGGDLILLGSERPIDIDLEPFRELWKTSDVVQRHFYESGAFHPDSYAGHYLMTRTQALELVGEGPLNTDDRPLLEFSAPFSLYARESISRNQHALWGVSDDFAPPTLQLDQEQERWALFGAVNREDFATVKRELRRLGNSHPYDYLLAAEVARKQEMENEESSSEEKVHNIYRGCLEKFPNDPLAAAHWAEFEYEHSHLDEAVRLYQIALQNPLPGSIGYLQRKLGQSYLKMEQPANAVPSLLISAKQTPLESTALAVAADAAVALQNDRRGDAFAGEALRRNPFDPAAHLAAASAKFNLGEIPAAESHLKIFLDLVPDYPPAWNRLGLCLRALRRPEEARQAYLKVLEVDSGNTTAVEALLELEQSAP